ncbi:MAG: xanthine dehydrogenase family protein subunit M [Acidobacteriota bacterium]
MKNFVWAEPRSVEQVLALLGQGDKKIALMAGGTDLFTEIKESVVEPDIVVDLNGVRGLSYIKKDKDSVHIGALTTLAALAGDSVIRTDFPGLHEAAESLATPQLRNVGTVAGNLCQRPRCWYYRDGLSVCRKKGGSQCFAAKGRNKYHAIFGGGICHIVYPSDLAPMLIALDAEVAISTPRGDKNMPLAEFYALPSKNVRRENVLGPDEIVREVKIPLAKKGDKSAYVKLRERGTWDFALASAAVKGVLSGKSLNGLKIVLGGVAPIPWRLEKAEKALQGKKLSGTLVKEASRTALQEARPLQENGYKVKLAEAAISRALLSLV